MANSKTRSGTTNQSDGTKLTQQAYTVIDSMTYAATITTNCANGNVHRVTLTGNATLNTPTNPQPGFHTWIFEQDTTGSRTLGLTSAFEFPGGTTITLSTAGQSKDVMTALYDGSNWLVVEVLDFQ